MDVTRLAGRCPHCGRTVAPDEPAGMCAACLLAAAAEPRLDTLASEAPTILSPSAAPEAVRGDGARLTDGQVVGPYRVGRLLGRGGMGEVYEAEHADSGRRLALKVLRGRLHDSEDRARFLREGQLAASVSHPHTVYIFGSEEIAGMPLISMELLPGGTLKDRVTERGPLPPPDAVSAVLDIIGGLDAAQAAGILHRDIKPSNCFTDADGTVKVGDFGLSISTLARDVQAGAAPGGFQGTPQFAPPEQLRGEPLDVRADIYAVGATLYYLLTGRAPFEADDFRALTSQVLTAPPPSPRRLRPEVPAGLASVTLQCLAKDPRARPASYAALAELLRPFSSAGATPARLGLRTAAGIADSLIIGLPYGLFNAWRVSDNPAAGGTSVQIDPWTVSIGLIYYLVLEGLTGASLGKRLFGLRIASASADRPATPAQIAARTVVYSVPGLTILVLLATVGRDELLRVLTASPVLASLLALVQPLWVVGMFTTVRRSNGYAALHDRITGTRVVARRAQVARQPGGHDASLQVPARSRTRCGPFDVVGDLGATGAGQLLAGFDPVLRRRVWIHVVLPGTPAVSDRRRDVGRVGRLHWLMGRRDPGESWDVYEAPEGIPWINLGPAGRPWPVASACLLDIATELAAATSDGSMPALGTDRIWIRRDGHALLLDFRAPGVDEAPGSQPSVRRDDTPPGLLSAIAADTVASAQAIDCRRPPAMPLSASLLLKTWAQGRVPAPEAARTEFAGVLGALDCVHRARRSVALLIAAAPTVLLLASAFAILPQIRAATSPERIEMHRLLDLLASESTDPPLTPQDRIALETYLAARHGASLTDARIWSSPTLRDNLKGHRGLAARIAADHPSVPPEDLAAAMPAFQRARDAHPKMFPSAPVRTGGTVVFLMLGISLLFSFLVSLVSAAAVPGGIVMRLLGLAVVTGDGTVIGRGRSMLRAIVAWSPAILWLMYRGTSPIVRTMSSPTSTAVTAIVTLVVLAAGEVWTIARPERGPVAWLTGTWVVPR